MKLSTHVLSSLDNWGENKKNFALMDACFAIEGTARNLYGKQDVGKKDYKNCIRQYFWILERMCPGINFSETKFDNVSIPKVEHPDMADVIYHIFRCNFAHCNDIPSNFELIPNNSDAHVKISKTGFQLRENIILGLLAISVFSQVNRNNVTAGAHYLSWSSHRFEIKDWWGREEDFRSIVEAEESNPARVIIKFK